MTKYHEKEALALHWDCNFPPALHAKGHISKEEFVEAWRKENGGEFWREILALENCGHFAPLELEHIYGRWSMGPRSHVDGTQQLRCYPEPGRGRFPITRVKTETGEEMTPAKRHILKTGYWARFHGSSHVKKAESETVGHPRWVPGPVEMVVIDEHHIKFQPREGHEVEGFGCYNAARLYLKALHYTLGSTQRGAPVAGFYDALRVSKWRKLSKREQGEAPVIVRAPRGTFRGSPAIIIFRSKPHREVDNA